MNTTHESGLSAWTMPLLRIGMGLFLAAWGMDKILGTEGSLGIFSNFYGIDVGALAIQLFGAAEILLGLLLAAGLFRIPLAWIQLLVNAVSTLASWKQILDPWGVLGLTDGGHPPLPRLHRDHRHIGGHRPQRPGRPLHPGPAVRTRLTEE